MFLGFNLRFFSVYQHSIIKNDKNRVFCIFASLLFMDSWNWGKWAMYKFIRLKILFLLIYHTQAKDIAVVKSGRRNYFRCSCLYDTLKNCHQDTFFRTRLKNKGLFPIDDHNEQKSKENHKSCVSARNTEYFCVKIFCRLCHGGLTVLNAF